MDGTTSIKDFSLIYFFFLFSLFFHLFNFCFHQLSPLFLFFFQQCVSIEESVDLWNVSRRRENRTRVSPRIVLLFLVVRLKIIWKFWFTHFLFLFFPLDFNILSFSFFSTAYTKNVDIENFGTSEEEEARECSYETLNKNKSYTHTHTHTYTYILLFIVEIVSMTSWPSSKYERIWWVLTWPINLVLLVTIPDCRRSKLRSWYPLTFIMCIIWIASTSYIVGWVITIIGKYFFFFYFLYFLDSVIW